MFALGQAQAQTTLEKIQEQGYIRIGFAKEFADWVCFFDQGKIAEEGPADTFFDAPQNPRTQQFLQAVMQAT